jgi:ATP-dependent Clp protease ATP-binding subunit ClpC
MFDRFTDHCKMAMALARQEALRHRSGWIDADHVLLGLLALRGTHGGNAARGLTILRALGVDLDVLYREADAACPNGDSMEPEGQLPFSQRSKKALEYMMEEASTLDSRVLGSEHLLLGLLRVRDADPTPVLKSLAVSLERARKEATRKS